MDSPCLSCGACCAAFRVSFYWAEADDGGGAVPAELTVQVTPFLRAMRGTEALPIRCVALEGAVGGACRCSIYDRRPTPCREFTASYADGAHEPRCDDARSRYGLAPVPRPDGSACTR